MQQKVHDWFFRQIKSAGLALAITAMLISCNAPDDPIPNQTPVEADFVIENLNQTVGSVRPVTITALPGRSTGSITIYYDGSTVLPTAAGTYSVTFNVAAAPGWNEAVGLVAGTLNINLADGNFVAPPAINVTFRQGLTLEDLHLPEGYAWNEPATVLNGGDEQLFAASFTHPSGNYETASGYITVNVARASGAVISAPTILTATSNSITVNAVEAPYGQRVEYAIFISALSAWQESTTFSNLSNFTGRTVYIFARSRENNNFTVGPAARRRIDSFTVIYSPAQRITFTGNTANVFIPNLEDNDVFLKRVNQSASVVTAVNTGRVLNVPLGLQSFEAARMFDMPYGECLFICGLEGLDDEYLPTTRAPQAFSQREAFIPPQVGDIRYFWVSGTPATGPGVWIHKPATLMATGKHGNIWVANNNLDGGASENRISALQAQSISDKFDIVYPATTNIFGFEYGGGPGGHGGRDGDPKIQILIYDVSSPNNIGFFASRDWFDSSLYSSPNSRHYSNNAEMFYLNAPWVIREPNTIYSTLVHELQHLIHWNEKRLRLGSYLGGAFQPLGTPAWFNEMLSHMAQVLIDPIIDVNPTNLHGMLLHFLRFYHEFGITEWVGASSRPLATVFGAHLLHNFGGAELARRIMANDFVGIASIDAALRELNPGWSFRYALGRFGEVLLFSGNSIPEGVLTFDRTVTSTVNRITYTLPGFNILDRVFLGITGNFQIPRILNLSPMDMRPHSIIIQSSDAWQNKTGNLSFILERPSNASIEFYIMVR